MHPDEATELGRQAAAEFHGDPQMTKLDEARRKVASDFHCKIEKAAEDRIREIARDEFAKLSPGPVGDDGRKNGHDRLTPTPPAEGSDGGDAAFDPIRWAAARIPAIEARLAGSDGGEATASWDNSLAEANEKIAELEARLAEAERRSRMSGRALAEAEKRIEAVRTLTIHGGSVDGGVRTALITWPEDWPLVVNRKIAVLLSPASEGKTDG